MSSEPRARSPRLKDQRKLLPAAKLRGCRRSQADSSVLRQESHSESARSQEQSQERS